MIALRPSRVIVVALLAGAPACILFGIDDLTGDGGPTTNDASIADATSADVLQIPDAGFVDSGATDADSDFTCTGVDATFCDDFNRDAAIQLGAPWGSSDTRPECTLGLVDGQLVSTFDASVGNLPCYLISTTTSALGHFSLDFDMSYATDSASSYAIVAQIQMTLPSPNDAGQKDEWLQLYLNGLGAGYMNLEYFYPDAAASPQAGVSYPFIPLASATPFTRQSPQCHMTIEGDVRVPSATATATCGTLVTTMNAKGLTPPGGFAAPAQILLGFANPTTTLPIWSITYDNMIFRELP